MMSKKLSTHKISNLMRYVYRKIFVREIYYEGKEPPKSYAFEKKFFLIYGLFLFYSFIFLTALNFPDNFIINILTFGNSYSFGISLIVLFLTLSVLYSHDKVRIFIFEKGTILKQIVLYIGILFCYYYLFSYLLYIGINFISILLFLSTIWLILLSTRFYIYSRRFATKIESKFISKYSIVRNFIVFITPYFILGLLVFIALLYRSLLVFISLDFFGTFIPEKATMIYTFQMRVIMPLIYCSLILALLFILLEFIFTRRKAETKRAGLYDNFTFSFIILFIFFFQILQISIYFILHKNTVDAIKSTVGATSTTVTSIFIFEFIISMYFLYRIVKKLGRSLGWQLLIFKRDGLILLILGCVLAQTLSRFALQTQVSNQEITLIGNIFMANKYIISVLMIIFLGVTILIYYLKPHETSMFIRMLKETVSKEEKAMNKIYKMIKSEYIRRGEPFPVEILERDLIRATKLPKKKIYSLIKELSTKDINLMLIKKRENNVEKIYIEFLSITERFEKKEIADKKVKKFLSEKLVEAMSKKEQELLKTRLDNEKDSPSMQFFSSLIQNLDKKQKELDDETKKNITSKITFKKKGIPESLKLKIMEILRKEYIRRIEDIEKFPDFHYSISEIALKIQEETRISPGELFPILEYISKTDLEFELIPNPQLPEDKRIYFFPLSDERLNNSLKSFRPKEYREIQKLILKLFLKYLKTKKNRNFFKQIRNSFSRKGEMQESWRNIYAIIENYYPKFKETIQKIRDGKNINEIFAIFPRKDIEL